MAIPSLEEAHLRAVCTALADTSEGLTGSQIGRFLGDRGIEDPAPTITKRDRLFAALSAKQRSDGCANNIIAFIQHAMNPAQYVSAREQFEIQRRNLNAALLFCGYALGEDGKVQKATAVRTLSEAAERAGVLRKALVERKVHADVLRFCKAELVQDNYFHAVFEATKSVADKIRQRAGLSSDGGSLVDEAFGVGSAGHPRLAFNARTTETERSEHSGLMNLIKGLFGAFRNTTAHAPKITWPISEQDALDILTLASLIHRRIDAAVRTHVP